MTSFGTRTSIARFISFLCSILNFQWNRQQEMEPTAHYSFINVLSAAVTMPQTDLWQRTYYHFRNDNAPVLQLETEEKYFSFIVKTDFTESHIRSLPVMRFPHTFRNLHIGKDRFEC